LISFAEGRLPRESHAAGARSYRRKRASRRPLGDDASRGPGGRDAVLINPQRAVKVQGSDLGLPKTMGDLAKGIRAFRAGMREDNAADATPAVQGPAAAAPAAVEGRGDQAVAVEQRRAGHGQEDHRAAAAGAELKAAQDRRGEGGALSLAAVIGAPDPDDVLERDDEQQRPERGG
jgi:Sec-independent protein translocase protein TatA